MFPFHCPPVGAGSGGSVATDKSESFFLAQLWGFNWVFINISMPPETLLPQATSALLSR